MTANYKRLVLFHTTRFQRRILYISLIPCLLVIPILSMLISILFQKLNSAILFGTTLTSLQVVNYWGHFIFIFIWIFFTVLFLTVFKMSNELVGAFDRVFRELDKVIEGTSSRKITARENDDLVNELLERINVLIERNVK